MLRDFKIYISQVQSPKYASRWAKEIAKEINKPGSSQNQTLLIKQMMRDMAKVTNPAEAHKAADQFRKAIHDWEDGIRKQNQAANKQWMADALVYASKNAPKLPRGHTVLHQNRDRRQHHEVVLDRKRFTDSASYDIDYARGF
jgi:hypothetical protein